MKYIGEELDLFRHARNWKRYHASAFRPFVRGRVLDVGCGLGVNARYLVNTDVSHYTFLEPDRDLLDAVEPRLTSEVEVRLVQGTTNDVAGEHFDTILYLDVIEHIEHSTEELQSACDLLAPGGHLLILVPAYAFLYSLFDKAIGHFRRYDKSTLRKELPPELEPIRTIYLDSLGLLMSLGNKLLLKQSAPKLSQVLFWDRNVIPVSRITDKLFLHAFGRSLLSISRKPLGS